VSDRGGWWSTAIEGAAGSARSVDAERALVADDPHAIVVERGRCRRRGGGAVVDDHDLELDGLLGERTRQRRRQKRPAVAGRDDD